MPGAGEAGDAAGPAPSAAAAAEWELADAPEDGVSSLEFHPSDPRLLLAGSWDRTARVYRLSSAAGGTAGTEEDEGGLDGPGTDPDPGQRGDRSSDAPPGMRRRRPGRRQREREPGVGDGFWSELAASVRHKAPVLDAAFAGPNAAFAATAGLDSTVNIFDVATSTLRMVGRHGAAVRAVKSIPGTDCLVTCSWDKTVKLFDTRAATAEQGCFRQPDKVYALGITLASNSVQRLVVATAGRDILVYDLRNMNQTEQRRVNVFKYQTRVLTCMPDGKGYVVGNIGGRIAVEFFDPSPASQRRKYSFKCHRVNEDCTTKIYSVNALAFHPVYGTFASGGSDAVVNVWDGSNKKRIRQLPRYPTGISALAFNATGDMLGVASSYSWDEGEKDHPPDRIYIREVQEIDVRPKRPSPE